jgi:hypothetical protein
MKLAYEASNSVEGHMVLNLFENAGLSGRIDGEYLQGGIGELPAMGLVKVMVDDADYDEARLIIKQWESDQTSSDPVFIEKKSNGLKSGIIGFAGGIVVMAAYYHTPLTEDGIDYNGDGNLDEKWTSVNYRISEVTQDRNFDGKVDVIHSYNHRGLIESSSTDDNFDGTFETEFIYEKGNVYRVRSDTAGDGFMDYRESHKNGVLDKISFLNPESNSPVKVKNYVALKLKEALVDTTGDGVLDTRHEYDSNEEITNTSTEYSAGDID